MNEVNNILTYIKTQKKDKPLYILFDLVRNKKLLLEIPLYFDSFSYLYSETNPSLQKISPHLVQVDWDNKRQLDWIEENIILENMGVFFFSDESLNSLNKYFADMATIWKHESEDYNAGEAYFAFYDPRVFNGFLSGLGVDTVEFFDKIDSIFVEDEFDNNLLYRFEISEDKKIFNKSTISFLNKALESGENKINKQVFFIIEDKNGFVFDIEEFAVLTEFMERSLKNHEINRQIKKMSYQIKSEFSSYLENSSIGFIMDQVKPSVLRMQDFGFYKYKHLYSLSAWEVFYGFRYEKLDKDGILEKICNRDLNEDEKFKLFKKRILMLDLT